MCLSAIAAFCSLCDLSFCRCASFFGPLWALRRSPAKSCAEQGAADGAVILLGRMAGQSALLRHKFCKIGQFGHGRGSSHCPSLARRGLRSTHFCDRMGPPGGQSKYGRQNKAAFCEPSWRAQAFVAVLTFVLPTSANFVKMRLGIGLSLARPRPRSTQIGADPATLGPNSTLAGTPANSTGCDQICADFGPIFARNRPNISKADRNRRNLCRSRPSLPWNRR